MPVVCSVCGVIATRIRHDYVDERRHSELVKDAIFYTMSPLGVPIYYCETHYQPNKVFVMVAGSIRLREVSDE